MDLERRVEVRPVGRGEFMTQSYSRNVAACALVRTTVHVDVP